MADNTICLAFFCFNTTDVGEGLANSSYYNSTSCALSPRSQSLSTVLAAFVGSIITGISSGHQTAFFVAWTAWLAVIRILVVAVWEVYEAVHLNPLKGGSQFFAFYDSLQVFRDARAFDDPFFRNSHETPPSILGWVGWTYSALYAPTVEILWLVENWYAAPGSYKLVRGLGVAVAALPLTIDTRSRYGDVVGMRLGSWARYLFNLLTATSCMLLGLVSSILLCLAAYQVPVQWYIIIIYILFAAFWMHVGMSFQIPHDEARTNDSVSQHLAGLAMGIFGGCFLAAPAFALFVSAPSSPGLSIGEYLSCESVATWKKLVAIVP